jgi:hypothetical protein
VKGKGVKVRCAKCNNTFTVAPPGDVQVPASPPPQLEQPTPEPTGPLKESLPPTAPEPLQKAGEDQAAPPSMEIEAKPGSDVGAHKPTPRTDETTGFRAQRPAHEMDKNLSTAPSDHETHPAKPELGDFEIEGTFREGGMVDKDLPAGPLSGDLPETASIPEGDMGWGNISLGEQADLVQDGAVDLAAGPGYQPSPRLPSSMDGEPSTPPPSEQEPEPLLDQSLTPAYQIESPRSQKGRKSLVLLLFLFILAGGGYFAYPKVMEIIGSQGPKFEGTLTPDKIQVRSLTRDDGKVVYTVRGDVRNDSSGSLGYIQVEAQFRNSNGDVVAKSTSYCGNVFEDEDLITSDLGKLQVELQNELGQSLSNRSIQPGQIIPFLIILENPPSGISKVTVTISDFKETT